ncbi:hypothetical protein NDU88_000181 [Pleurodeles waltl]|uniref:Uncharacterized protein n=1 Tax=Pleurodeles waltl TaxID=8319 RepID=A0AAV7KNV6_PLEWA|nr:hypothetical protein NDU88_000181 [Pleurodeles waltl]
MNRTPFCFCPRCHAKFPYTDQHLVCNLCLSPDHRDDTCEACRSFRSKKTMRQKSAKVGNGVEKHQTSRHGGRGDYAHRSLRPRVRFQAGVRGGQTRHGRTASEYAYPCPIQAQTQGLGNTSARTPRLHPQKDLR